MIGVNHSVHVLQHVILTLQKAVSTVASILSANAGPTSHWVEAHSNLPVKVTTLFFFRHLASSLFDTILMFARMSVAPPSDLLTDSCD